MSRVFGLPAHSPLPAGTRHPVGRPACDELPRRTAPAPACRVRSGYVRSETLQLISAVRGLTCRKVLAGVRVTGVVRGEGGRAGEGGETRRANGTAGGVSPRRTTWANTRRTIRVHRWLIPRPSADDHPGPALRAGLGLADQLAHQ